LGLSKRLAGAPDPVAVRHIAVEAIAAFGRAPACLLTNERDLGTQRLVASAPGTVELSDKEQAAAAWAFERGLPSGYHSDTLSSVRWRFLPLMLEDNCYGVLGIELASLSTPPRSEQLLMLDALATQVTLTLSRTQLTASLAQARVAEETERLRSALLSSVSHDLRTPLSSMIGAASTLRELPEQLTESDRHELLDAILSEGRRLNRYIDNLLDMTRLGHGNLALDRDWVTLADVVAAALRRLREVLKGLRIVRDIPDTLPLLYVQPALIEQALVNIIDNAARFSPAGGEMRIAGRCEQEQMLITVTDRGPGIPEADRKRVFDMFFSGEGGDTGRHGSGLGLAICHGMVGAHGGTIEALAGTGGVGTTIAMRLPMYELPQDTEDEQANDHDPQ
ncbi:MAG: ATP-binding protein, partial [Sinobacteraceae bacterium]|nr:ATP-binding protein [Nevskiaceae bacterium]